MFKEGIKIVLDITDILIFNYNPLGLSIDIQLNFNITLHMQLIIILCG